jgi:2-furoyl-CoA dehydrogenase large subunit
LSSTTITEERSEQAKRGFIGVSIPRKEDERLVQGEGTFFDDVKRHGMGYVHFVRSPYAHARIVHVDVSQALALPGVFGTLTGDEAALLTEPFSQLGRPPASTIKDYCLAVGKVRYMGDPVAAVVAATRELARDAAMIVEVEYEPLPVVVDGVSALSADAPLLHEHVETNVVFSDVFEWGDVDGAFAEADHVVKIGCLHFHRFSSTPLECSGCLVEYDRAIDEWSIVCTHHQLGICALMMGGALGVGLNKLRFQTRDIGGGFGVKTMQHPQITACALLARKLSRPVLWTESRTEHHTAGAHGNERTFLDVEVPVKADGRMLGFRARAVDDCGSTPRYEPLGAVIWSQVAAGVYRWRNLRLDFTQVCTNKTPVAPNRGYSRMQHLWMMERVIDIVAHELALDPVEVRKRNYVRADEMPYETPNGCVYDSGDYARCLDIALDLIDYRTIEHRRTEAASRGKILGVGIGSTLDSGTNNFGQSQIMNPSLTFSGNNEVATVKLDMLGEIVVTLGTIPQGQGHETVAAQVTAGILGVSPDDVFVRPGHDTYFNSHAAFSGTYASQFAVTGLGAVKGAAELLVDEIRLVAGAMLGVPANEIALADGMASAVNDGTLALSIAECGAIVNTRNAELPPELRSISLNCRYVYRPPFEVPDPVRKFGNLTLTYACQIHACVVEVDPSTGVYEIVDYAAVDDCGVRIHPQIVEGQVHGAIAHALGAAQFETFEYDEQGTLLTANFYDYHVPHALDMPPLKTAAIESPSPFTPLGAKGMGEGGGGGIHCVCSALQDALAQAGGGAVILDSHNPYWRVWELLNDPAPSRALVEVESR